VETVRTHASRHVGSPALARASVAAAGLAAFAILRVRDPHVAGSYGFCPFRELTGMWCPACGGLRATHDLAHGDLIASLSSNVFVVPLAAAAVLAWLWWVSGRPIPYRPSRVSMIVAMSVLLLFTVARNTGWGEWLAPG